LAIAWVLSRRPFTLIPGTSHVHRLRNAAAAGPSLSADTADALEHIFAPGTQSVPTRRATSNA
jgi:aryl-alcohol dehydrogenase-like predicted oxidoreductase